MSPSMLKAPYFLSEAIKKAHVYGTVDTSTMKDLANIHSKRTGKSQVGKNFQGMMKQLGQAAMKDREYERKTEDRR